MVENGVWGYIPPQTYPHHTENQDTDAPDEDDHEAIMSAEREPEAVDTSATSDPGPFGEAVERARAFGMREATINELTSASRDVLRDRAKRTDDSAMRAVLLAFAEADEKGGAT